MTLINDDELEVRIRASLDAWAERAPVTVDRSAELRSLPRARTRPVAALAAAAVLVVVALVATVLDRAPDETPTIAGPGAQAVVRIPVGARVGVRAIAAGGDAVWLMSSNDETLFRIDPVTDEVVASFRTPGYFEGMAVGGGLVWLAGYGPTRVVALDANTGEVVHEVPLDFDPWGITLAFGGAWVGGGSGLTRVDVESGAVTTVELGRSTGFAAAGDDTLWVADPDGDAVVEVDPDSGDVMTEVRVGGSPRGIEVAPDGSVWVTLPIEDAVVRVVDGGITRVDVGRLPDSLTVVDDEVWITTRGEGTITRIGGVEASVIDVHPVGNLPGGIVTAFDRVWVSLHQEDAVVAIDPRAPLPTTPAPSFAGWITVDDHDVYLRCRGAGDATVVLRQDVWHEAGALPVLEALLARRTRVCVTGRFEDPAAHGTDAGELPADLRGALESAGIPGPFVLVGHGYGGLIARELAATWDEVRAVVLLDANTRPTFVDPEHDDPFLQSIADRFELVDGLTIDVPIAVVTSDADAAADPRNGTPVTRSQWLVNQRRMADRLGATFTVVHGDAWVPTYRPAAVVDVIMDLVERLA